ncbi:hypothetical protein EBU99_12570 [bacterium]|nr:hypothetical protein [bacterium]
MARTFAAFVAAATLVLNLSLAAQATAANNNPLVDKFAELLTGLFDSSAQGIDDSEYLDVTVRHCAVTVTDLPENFNSGRFLALRQSVSTSKNPYRVRILRIFSGEQNGTVKVSSFAAQSGVDLAELCFKPEAERIVSFTQLSEEKCTTSSHLEGDVFVGGTSAEGCKSERSGAVRMTSEIRLDEKGFSTWDRGWDSANHLVWGPEKGPYKFERVSSQDVQLSQIAAFFSGRLSNAEQVKADPQNFMPVEYEFCQIDAAGSPLRPATRLMLAHQIITTPARTLKRNRIYEFFRTDEGKIGIRTNPFDETKVPADICQKSLEERRSIDPQALAQRDTCVLSFDWQEDAQAYVGSTPKDGCASTFQGAVKFTSEETIKDGMISPWERWLNAQGEQVAGSKVGPYIYKRIQN